MAAESSQEEQPQEQLEEECEDEAVDEKPAHGGLPAYDDMPSEKKQWHEQPVAVHRSRTQHH